MEIMITPAPSLRREIGRSWPESMRVKRVAGQRNSRMWKTCSMVGNERGFALGQVFRRHTLASAKALRGLEYQETDPLHSTRPRRRFRGPSKRVRAFSIQRPPQAESLHMGRLYGNFNVGTGRTTKYATKPGGSHQAIASRRYYTVG